LLKEKKRRSNGFMVQGTLSSLKRSGNGTVSILTNVCLPYGSEFKRARGS